MGEGVIFKEFCDQLRISSEKRSTIQSRFDSISLRLNKDFWDMETTHGAKFVGSYGRGTANSWVSDVDMLFEMPRRSYRHFDNYASNGQSALLQAVKKSIEKTYWNTSLKGDGQIVKVKFSDNETFEVLPAFKQEDGSYLYADSNNGGTWRSTNPDSEIELIDVGDRLTNNNLRRLCRMMRAWKYYCSAPINGLLLDSLAYRFLVDWQFREESYLYYDWMTRDFFSFLKDQQTGQTIWFAVGSQQSIHNPQDFRFKATVAFNRSREAINLYNEGKISSAKQKWREIYGHRFPD